MRDWLDIVEIHNSENPHHHSHTETLHEIKLVLSSKLAWNAFNQFTFLDFHALPLIILVTELTESNQRE